MSGKERLTPFGVVDSYFCTNTLGWSSFHAQRILELLEAEGYVIVNASDDTQGEWNPAVVTNPDCVICQWIGERIMRFNDEMKQAILASAPPPITYRRWLPGDTDKEQGSA